MDLVSLRVYLITKRYQKGWSQYDLADAMGIRQAQVSALETGRAYNPYYSTILNWCGALGVPFGPYEDEPEEQAHTTEVEGHEDWDGTGRDLLAALAGADGSVPASCAGAQPGDASEVGAPGTASGMAA